MDPGLSARHTSGGQKWPAAWVYRDVRLISVSDSIDSAAKDGKILSNSRSS